MAQSSAPPAHAEGNLEPLCAIVTPTGMLGYGFDEQLLNDKIEELTALGLPVAVCVDSGSTDSGPEKLALGTMTCPQESYVRELTKLVKVVINHSARLLVSSCGGDGSNDHLDLFVELVKDIALSLKRLDIVLTGRAYDPAIFVTFCAFNLAGASSPPLESLNSNLLGGFTHIGKILECGGVCTTPKTAGAVAFVYRDGTFDVSALDPIAKCVPLSVAAHTLYEKTRPDILVGPGGALNLSRTTYEQLPDGVTVRVRGGDFKFAIAEGRRYTIKLEGARVIGHRYLFYGSFGDPILIGQIHEYLDNVRKRCAFQHPGQDGKWKLEFHIYGAPERPLDSLAPIDEDSMPKQVFVMGEVLADTHELAKSVASIGRVACCHGHYRGQIVTGGNFGFGIGGKTEVDVGKCCEFNVYHLINLADGEQIGSQIFDGQGKVAAKDRTAGGIFPWQVLETGTSTSAVATTNGASPQAKKNAPPLNGHQKEKAPTKQLGQAKTLRDIAKIIRSKNSGPYQVTFDVIFDDPALYEAVKKSGDLSQEAVAKLFGRSVNEVSWCGFFDQALAFKLTLPQFRNGKLCGSGGFGENDVHASQQYFPLMKLPLSEDLKRTLQTL
ncbi:hypothetical protein H2200_005967 [Cladophialophora chaetospira]|uniref:DUF4387 domain-containing protein n=1 Tax=Cladophialophora chaetospira TaxID=386627 RepID=A0AA38XA20_9EURO|nr:hypothetical protein H2200_005967 [Cladophialophora chaetospira]